MTPTDFQTLAIGWIGTAVVVGGAIIAAYATLKGKIDDLQAKHEHNADVLQSHEDRITTLDDPFGKPSNVAFNPPQVMGPMKSTDVMISKDGVLGIQTVTMSVPLPDPQAFRQPLGQPQKPSA